MKPFARARRAWHAARVKQHWAKGSFDKAFGSFAEMQAIQPLDSPEQMCRYYLLILVERYDEAFVLLDEICWATDAATTEDGRFMNFHARATRANGEGDNILADHLRRQMTTLRPSGRVKFWLQLD